VEKSKKFAKKRIFSFPSHRPLRVLPGGSVFLVGAGVSMKKKIEALPELHIMRTDEVT
jgi:hypothetical protein